MIYMQEHEEKIPQSHLRMLQAPAISLMRNKSSGSKDHLDAPEARLLWRMAGAGESPCQVVKYWEYEMWSKRISHLKDLI